MTQHSNIDGRALVIDIGINVIEDENGKSKFIGGYDSCVKTAGRCWPGNGYLSYEYTAIADLRYNI